MALITHADAPTVAIPGIRARPMAVPSRGSTELAIWYLEVAPGVTGEPHTVDREEVFVLQSGQATAALDGTEYRISPGDALLVPPGVPFAIRNTGDEPARYLVCTSAGITATLNGRVVEPAWAK